MPKPRRVPPAFLPNAVNQARKANNPLLFYHLAQWHLANGRVKEGLGSLEAAGKADLRHVDPLSRPRFSSHVPAVASAIAGREKQFADALSRLPQEILFIQAMPNWEISPAQGGLHESLPNISKTQRQLAGMMTNYAHYTAFTDEYLYRQMFPSRLPQSPQPPAEPLSSRESKPRSLNDLLAEMRSQLKPAIERSEK